MERGANRRRGHFPYRAAPRHGAALRPAARAAADPRQSALGIAVALVLAGSAGHSCAMKLAELLSDEAGADNAAVEVTGVTSDSRAVQPGNIFVAIAGAKA